MPNIIHFRTVQIGYGGHIQSEQSKVHKFRECLNVFLYAFAFCFYAFVFNLLFRLCEF